MKIVFAFFILFFSKTILGDEITDFQIEGMSVRESLLNYYTESEIKNSIEENSYNDDEFYQVYLTDDNFKNYEGLQINLKKGDSNFIIYSISGGLFFENDIENCKIKKNEIVNQISQLLVSAKKTDSGTYDAKFDPTGESKITAVYFEIGEYDRGADTIMIYCSDWSKRIEKELNWADTLRVSIDTKEYDYWINTKAYSN